ncbi:hypothetical protein ASC77_10730 [Nocardioides sp. Root1257]|uniref:hypothetical protein n=1 Tax=unclassified Nocardioides TaxID=2615069 RepID=UPI0006F4AC67|nr:MULTISPECIES: hypothetical protein [unclassified Nocardioides]KQW49160.1 hypothetical protein ASC77_10730 [Nocardioides sp. Root1257]KRC48334.1 hypothetical protein ASE24_10735 [Nocardioides sp. Root224]
MSHDSSGDLTRTLRERADDVTGTALTFDDVRGRAGQIRRRRRAGVAAGVALVAAVVLPIALLGGAGADKSDPGPANPSPTHAVDPNAAGVPTLQDDVIIYPEGPRIPVRLPRNARVMSFTPLWTDRFVISTLDDDGTKISLLDQNGNGVDHFPTTGGSLAVAADRSAVAWMGTDGSPQLLVAGSDAPRTLGRVPGVMPALVAITGDCRTDCEVVGRSQDGKGEFDGSWAASSNGGVRDLPTALPAVMDATSDGDLLAAITGIAADDIHACGGVYDVGAADLLWDTCEDNVFLFSPDGALVMTLFAEGAGPLSLTIRDARSGAPVATYDDGLIKSWAWEDDDHLLAVVAAADGAVSLQRIGTDGRSETVLDGFHVDDPTLDVPLQLPRS